ncbi:MAG TPA: dihydrodipicolinate synthase family protein [Candidatus Hydrogenedentes bacterium]|nr:dihydrodipicolinate synthase family protein [Candidatus Hydrogenedentota bacterium]HNT86393.1 dihydrodipicolinate synthase family protein [Candidatus Hydrogenedentota bacterium]
MTPEFLRGSIAPVFTAFNEDLSFDEEGQRRLLDFLLDRGGISAYFLRSGMGQMYAFSYEEAQQMARVGCAHLRGRAPALIGCAGIWDRNRDRRPDPEVYTRQSIELGKYAQDQGADGVVFTIPEGLAPNTGQTHHEVVLRFFEAITGALSGPILIYQPPGTDEDYCVTPDLMRALSALPNVCGIKLSTMDAEYMCAIGAALEGSETVFICGCETVFYAALPSGARAVIGQGATLNPHVLNAIQTRVEAGDWAGAMQAQRVANHLCRSGSNPVEFFKRYAAEHGYAVKPYGRLYEDNPYIKSPTPLSPADYLRFKALFEAECAPYG